MKFVNLTPHALNVHCGEEDVRVIAPSGEVARVSVTDTPRDAVGGIPTVASTVGDVTGLPAPVAGVVLIVSGMVAAHAPREDVVSPGALVRDADGRPCGCLGLRRSL